jgi:hypothetical protein
LYRPGISCLHKNIDSPQRLTNSAVASSAATVQKDMGSDELNAWLWDDCTNEQVNITGTIRWNNILVYDGNYGYSNWYMNTVHVRLTNIKAVGTTSGSAYQVININNYTAFNDSSFNLYRYKQYSALKIVAPKHGSTMTLTQHVTLNTNAKGTTVVTKGIDDYTLSCK